MSFDDRSGVVANQIAAGLRRIWPPSLVGDTNRFKTLVCLSLHRAGCYIILHTTKRKLLFNKTINAEILHQNFLTHVKNLLVNALWTSWHVFHQIKCT